MHVMSMFQTSVPGARQQANMGDCVCLPTQQIETSLQLWRRPRARGADNLLAPTYLSELIEPYKNQRNLRSNNQYLLRVPKSRTTTFGDRAFSASYGTIYQVTLNLHHR